MISTAFGTVLVSEEHGRLVSFHPECLPRAGVSWAAHDALGPVGQPTTEVPTNLSLYFWV